MRITVPLVLSHVLKSGYINPSSSALIIPLHTASITTFGYLKIAGPSAYGFGGDKKHLYVLNVPVAKD
jgi:hypothetical protein